MQEIIREIKRMIGINNRIRKIQTKKEITLEYQLNLNKTIIDTYENLKKKDKWATDIELVRNEQEEILKTLGFENIETAVKKYNEDKKALYLTKDLLKELTLEKKMMEDDIKRLSQLDKFGVKNEIDEEFIKEMKFKY